MTGKLFSTGFAGIRTAGATAILLLAGCGGGTDVFLDDASAPLPPPRDGLRGIVIKGAISGGSVTVTDASGAVLEIVQSTFTGADGRYALTFSEAEVSRGIEAPLTLTVTGGTAVCDVDLPDTNDDCEIADETFLSFGQVFELEEDFVLRGTLASLSPDSASEPVYTLNVSPATDLATALAETAAEGSALTPQDVEDANEQVLLLLELLTDIELPGSELARSTLFDVTALTVGNAASTDMTLVLVAFASAVLSEFDPGDTDTDTLPEILTRLKTELTVNDEGNLVATGTTLSRLSASMAIGLQTLNLQLAGAGESNAALEAAQVFATRKVGEYALRGEEEIQILGTQSNASAVFYTQQFARSLDSATRLPSGDYTNGTVTLRLDGRGGGAFILRMGAREEVTAELTADGAVFYADGTAEMLADLPQ